MWKKGHLARNCGSNESVMGQEKREKTYWVEGEVETQKRIAEENGIWNELERMEIIVDTGCQNSVIGEL